jgi:hypothetical protein
MPWFEDPYDPDAAQVNTPVYESDDDLQDRQQESFLHWGRSYDPNDQQDPNAPWYNSNSEEAEEEEKPPVKLNNFWGTPTAETSPWSPSYNASQWSRDPEVAERARLQERFDNGQSHRGSTRYGGPQHAVNQGILHAAERYQNARNMMSPRHHVDQAKAKTKKRLSDWFFGTKRKIF